VVIVRDCVVVVNVVDVAIIVVVRDPVRKLVGFDLELCVVVVIDHWLMGLVD
jgi:hypothetical protein